MKKVYISFLSLLGFLGLSWCGLYLGDLASIGGYDGVAPEHLAQAFWYGEYSNWLRAVEIGAMAALVIGPAGTILSLTAMAYFAVKVARKRA